MITGSALLTFAIGAVLSHWGVGAALTSVLGAAGGKLAAQAITGGAAAGVKRLLQRIHDGHPVTDEQRVWLSQNAEELYLVPKLQPGADDAKNVPDIWDTPVQR